MGDGLRWRTGGHRRGRLSGLDAPSTDRLNPSRRAITFRNLDTRVINQDRIFMGQYSIGQPVSRREDPRLLRGEGHFLQDTVLAGEAQAAILRSPYAHASIGSIDRTEAESMQGVLAILIGADYAADGLGSIPCDMSQSRRDGSPMYRPHRPAFLRSRRTRRRRP